MRCDRIRDRRNPNNWDFDTHDWEWKFALKKLIQIAAFDDADALSELRERFSLLEDKRPRCPQCHRRGCEPWNHNTERNPKAVCVICYQADCTATEHANAQ